MNGRRGFFAFIGNAAVTGLVAHRASATTPTLILPPAGLIEPSNYAPADYPLLAAQETHMHAFLAIRGGLTAPGLPDGLYLDWLEGGLRQVKGCQPGGAIWRAIQMDRAEGRVP